MIDKKIKGKIPDDTTCHHSVTSLLKKLLEMFSTIYNTICQM